MHVTNHIIKNKFIYEHINACPTISNKANLRDLIAVTGLVILIKLDSNHRFLNLCDLFYTASSFVHHFKSIVNLNLKFDMTLENKRTPLLYYTKLCASFQCDGQIQNVATVPKSWIQVKSTFFVLCDLEIWWMTLGNNRVPLLYCFKLWPSFHSHHWIQTGVTVQKRPISVKSDGFFLSRVWLRNFAFGLEKL